MKLNLNKQWFEQRIRAETCDVAAGVSSPLPTTSQPDLQEIEGLAFGRLIELLRRAQRLSVSALAAKANVSVEEIVCIEGDAKFTLDPQSVQRLADVFQLPPRALEALSSRAFAHSPRLHQAAVSFAADSAKISELTAEEQAALAGFVKVLSSQDG